VPAKVAVRNKMKEQAIELAIRLAIGPAAGKAKQRRASRQALGRKNAGKPAKELVEEHEIELAITRAGKIRLAVTQGTGQAQHQEIEQVIHTQSGRRSVKRVIFEAGMN